MQKRPASLRVNGSGVLPQLVHKHLELLKMVLSHCSPMDLAALYRTPGGFRAFLQQHQDIWEKARKRYHVPLDEHDYDYESQWRYLHTLFGEGKCIRCSKSTHEPCVSLFLRFRLCDDPQTCRGTSVFKLETSHKKTYPAFKHGENASKTMFVPADSDLARFVALVDYHGSMWRNTPGYSIPSAGMQYLWRNTPGYWVRSADMQYLRRARDKQITVPPDVAEAAESRDELDARFVQWRSDYTGLKKQVVSDNRAFLRNVGRVKLWRLERCPTIIRTLAAFNRDLEPLTVGVWEGIKDVVAVELNDVPRYVPGVHNAPPSDSHWQTCHFTLCPSLPRLGSPKPEGVLKLDSTRRHRFGDWFFEENGRHSPAVHKAPTLTMEFPRADIAPWLEGLDEVPPTPPPKPYRYVSPQNSYDSDSCRKDSMASSTTSSFYTSYRPSTNFSVSTGDSMGLDVDDYGQALMVPELDLPPIHDAEIAPWLDRQEPPSTPPKNGRTFHFPAKSSFSSLRAGSSAGLFSRQRGPSESHSSLADSTIASTSTSMMHEPQRDFLTASPELRKSKSSMLTTIRNKVSRRNLRSNSTNGDDSEHPSLRPPPLNNNNNSVVSFFPVPSPPPTPRFKRPKKRSGHQDDIPPLPSIEPPDPGEQEIKLDMNFDEMDDIVDRAVLGTEGANGSSPSSGIASSHSRTFSDNSQFGSPHFNNPFQQTSTPLQPPYQRRPSRKVSPNTVLPIQPTAAAGAGTGPAAVPGAEGVNAEGWTAPESWSVAVKDGKLQADAESSSDESTGPGRPKSHHPANGHSGVRSHRPLPPVQRENGAPPVPPPTSKRLQTKRASTSHHPKMRIRIYKADNTYHVVSVGSNVTVGALTPKLDMKLPVGEEKEMHQLCLRERGRERILASTEKPGDIVRRRLEQAGYDESDGIELLSGAGLGFILKFVYKSLFLGPAEEELRFDNFEYIDLSGRSLRTIPVVLHQHADSIVSLRLSRNPMIEIPLDFIQSCTTLRELRLSHMAMKKVPHSLRHSSTLTRLDLSCNRIATLDEAYLDDIPGLTTLFVQNNRLEKLPWSFPRMRRLITLNISNNKFKTFPEGVSELGNLRDLDISFNLISELPEGIGSLKNLERLVIVGNQVTRLPDEFSSLGKLGELDCRRNQISDLTAACMLPKIETLSADHNSLHDLTMSLGPNLITLDASHNEITQLSFVRGPVGRTPLGLTSLDVSNAKLSLIDEYTLSQLTSLRKLKLDNNSIRTIPDSLGELRWLETLSCADNALVELPASIGKLQKLENLDVHNNSLTELPLSLWNCASLSKLNVTSNLLVLWHDPPPTVPEEDLVTPTPFDVASPIASGPIFPPNRRPSTTSLHDIPPLAHSLEMLYLGENRFTDEVLHPLMVLKELRVLNLSFNDIQDMPSNFFKNLTKLEEVYLSGNGLTNFPSEDLPRLTRLSTLFLNGNRLHTLPQELGKVKSLTILDVGSNMLKYNINNWEFDWNWNFNKNLRYLNLSGNKRLQIKSDATTPNHRQSMQIVNRESLAGFSELTQLRVLGLMDVTITTTGQNMSMDIPDENDDRRIRTSSSVVNGMSYGIADTLGKNQHVNMLDLVHEFRGVKKDAVFAMFGRALPPKQLPAATTSNWFAKYLQENFVRVFISQLNAINPERSETATDALRRSFLKLNQELHDLVFSPHRKLSHASVNMGSSVVSADPSNLRSGASGVVVYIVDRKMYVANAGNALAVISRGRSAYALSRKHDPYDRAETTRVRAAEGWVSPPGLVNDELDISRSFGFFHLLPIVNARPDVFTHDLTELDEFVIIANRGLWDYVSYQTAVDIAHGHEPMVAAQKLRDFAISYGAEGSTMIMVIGVSDLFKSPSAGPAPNLRKKRGAIGIIDRDISRLQDEVAPPTGHVAIVFSDIRGSTHLWEANPGMPTAMRLHNTLCRRWLRLCGGYEVKTEGDAFMVSFPTTLAAVWWCMQVQIELLNVAWPLEILECADGKTVYDESGRMVARGFSADPITNRMDYFGPIVNRSARIANRAAGGQIMCSFDIIREINAKIFESDAETEYSDLQPREAIEAIRRLDPVVLHVGETKLKGIENPEVLGLLLPAILISRQDFVDESPVDPSSSSNSRVQFSVDQMRDLGMLCLRLEMSSSGRVFRPLPERKGSLQQEVPEDFPAIEDEPVSLHGDPNVLLPPMNNSMTDAELMLILYSLMVRIENAETTLRARAGMPPAPSDEKQALMSALQRQGGLDERTLDHVLSVLRSI
ncbi:Adenylate cyclase [Mycena kentingensis (nom. inval.)]|nr:Adenylate cyclase [Mycena kentingensis (nom. inval.)]